MVNGFGSFDQFSNLLNKRSADCLLPPVPEDSTTFLAVAITYVSVLLPTRPFLLSDRGFPTLDDFAVKTCPIWRGEFSQHPLFD